MRFFLYSYGDAENFKISKNLGVFGCKKRKGGMETKFKNFQKGDIILIRDSSSKKQLKFFGYCKVIGPVLDYDYNKGQFPEFLWEDEKRNKQILYPLRIAVSFSEVPHLNQLHKISWDDILKLNLKNKRGVVFSKTALAQFFSGNFLTESEQFTKQDIEKFINLIGLEDHKEETYEDLADYYRKLEIQLDIAQKRTPEERQSRISSSTVFPEKITTVAHVFKRNPDVIVEVLNRANGVCGSCHQKAPFTRASDGSPYLEVHHIIPLSENGEDTVSNAEALCPNCHRKMHFGL